MDGLRVLVAYASVCGSTAEIARAIALTLRRCGMDVEAMPAGEVADVGAYRGVVLGSAVYGGKWRREATELLLRFAPQLAYRDLWLFQSGPLDRSAQRIVQALPYDVAVAASGLSLKTHATFGGKLDSGTTGPIARMLARAGLAHDYRDFGEIRMWAEEVARSAAADSARRSRLRLSNRRVRAASLC